VTGIIGQVRIAPLKESLAAALVELSAWQDDMALLDPFCGSGTIVIEATLKALNIARFIPFPVRISEVARTVNRIYGNLCVKEAKEETKISAKCANLC
jgi:23S rRNA G2445 N2-methylase RlmL